MAHPVFLSDIKQITDKKNWKSKLIQSSLMIFDEWRWVEYHQGRLNNFTDSVEYIWFTIIPFLYSFSLKIFSNVLKCYLMSFNFIVFLFNYKTFKFPFSFLFSLLLKRTFFLSMWYLKKFLIKKPFLSCSTLQTRCFSVGYLKMCDSTFCLEVDNNRFSLFTCSLTGIIPFNNYFIATFQFVENSYR